ncbi:type II toxin-antitoxin system RelE/ParE family toxin [Mesorhizobium sp.]|uniref:type II toxin-antitoxin system RelE/ParE family toxin n=1 Tax=Mesorhizobium sp. TaxID=1871066 RepID=UPI0025C4CDBC|nr:type II toxin-antitoxin system RelE/ParE family toxin [Mesorhizobium sp.]
MRRLVFTAQAEMDLEAIGDHIALDNPLRAATFIQELRSDCLRLRTSPERHPVVERYRSLGVRRHIHGRYLIFYRVSPDAVEILHVLHGAVDFENILFP